MTSTNMKTLLVILIVVAYAQSSQFSEQMLKNHLKMKMLESQNLTSAENNGVVCEACKVSINALRGFNKKELAGWVQSSWESLCPKFEDANFCAGMSETYVNTFTDHFFNHLLNPQDVCSRIDACDPPYERLKLQDYIDEVLKDKLDENGVKQWSEIAKSKISGNPNFKVMQLADLHIDLEYLQGADAFCKDPFCCRAENGMASEPAKGAQYWGTYANCDVPLRTIENMIEFASRSVRPEMMIWTGDSISHDVWHQSQTNQTKPTRLVTETIGRVMEDVQLYPIFGNHEAYPADQYDSQGNGSQWLREETAEIWNEYLQSGSLQQLRENGYYSEVNDELNLRVIAMNTQSCDSLNFYLMDNVTDPSNQLQWLRNELIESERLHQFVYVFGHIPPGDTFCASQWSRRFSVLVERYQHVIKGMFYGHTHQDQLQLIRSQVDGRVLATVYVAPSGTTFSYQNPSFRVFDINGQTNEIMDYSQYRLDLAKANQQGEHAILDWQCVYKFVDEYALQALNPHTVFQLSNQLNNNDELLKRYIHHFYGGSTQLTTQQIKDLQNPLYRDSVRNFFVCGMQNGVFDDYYHCVGTITKFKDYNFFVFKLLESFTGNWKISNNDNDS